MQKITTVQCVICNATFQPRRSLRDGVQKCCSSKCRGIMATQRKTLAPVKCAQCGTVFTSRLRGKTGLMKYCSRACSSAGYKANAATIETLEQRLLAFRSVHPETGCWEWTGPLKPSGYGKIRQAGKHTSPHRIAAHIYLGMPVDSESFVCHKCDNQICFNPEHLYLGDAKTNAQDRVKRGRNAYIKGDQHQGAKLSEAKVVEIISLLNSGRSHVHLSKEYGVSRTTITLISLGKTWQHLPRG
jgi:hypothetical protein